MKIIHIKIKDCCMCPYKTGHYNRNGWVDYCTLASTAWIYDDKIPDWCPLPDALEKDKENK
jgi:hypothetical protein